MVLTLLGPLHGYSPPDLSERHDYPLKYLYDLTNNFDDNGINVGIVHFIRKKDNVNLTPLNTTTDNTSLVLHNSFSYGYNITVPLHLHVKMSNVQTNRPNPKVVLNTQETSSCTCRRP